MNRRALHGILVAACLLLFFVQSYIGIEQESMVFDEPTAIGSAFLAFRNQDLRIVRERPPLLGLFITAPIEWVFSPAIPLITDPDDRRSDMQFGVDFLHAEGNDTVGILKLCRLIVLALSIILGGLVYFWSREFGGSGAGLLAVALFALSPNLLAHSRIAANDMTCTVFVFASVLLLRRFWRTPTWEWALAAGVCLGAALTAKLSSIVILPIYLLIGYFGWADREDAGARWKWGKLCMLLGLSAFLAIGLFMGGTFDYASYFSGFGKIYSGTVKSYLFYLGGDISPQPWWYYHLYAAWIKTPISFLLLFVVGVGWAWSVRKQKRDLLLLTLPVLLVVGISCFDRTNIGLRRILPAYPFIIVLAAQAVHVPLQRVAKVTAFTLLLVWQAISVLRVTPHHLAYFNEFVGGPERGVYYLDDSNVDWGQELPGLKTWLDENPNVKPKLAYFGQARPETYGIVYDRMTRAEICEPAQELYAVSAHQLAFFEKMSKSQGLRCSWLTRYQPIDRIGYSIYLYDFR